MKVGYCIVLFCTLCCPGGVSRAADSHFLHGEVLDMDDASRVMLVRIVEDAKRCRVVRVILPQALLIESPDGKLSDHGCLSPGRHLRIWGNVVPNETGQFVAEEIRGCDLTSCSDPTGVRSRLSRNRGNRVNGGMCRECENISFKEKPRSP